MNITKVDNMINLLPQDILMTIFQYIPPRLIMDVCKRWLMIITDKSYLIPRLQSMNLIMILPQHYQQLTSSQRILLPNYLGNNDYYLYLHYKFNAPWKDIKPHFTKEMLTDVIGRTNSFYSRGLFTMHCSMYMFYHYRRFIEIECLHLGELEIKVSRIYNFSCYSNKTITGIAYDTWIKLKSFPYLLSKVMDEIRYLLSIYL